MIKTSTASAEMVRAEAAFKPVGKKAAPPSEWAIEKQRFDNNRERLKSERLARETLRFVADGDDVSRNQKPACNPS